MLGDGFEEEHDRWCGEKNQAAIVRFLRNAGTERTLDLIKPLLQHGSSMDMATSSLSLFAFAELLNELSPIQNPRLILPSEEHDLKLFGSEHDRAARNRLQVRWLALRIAHWLQGKTELRRVSGAVPQGAAVLRNADAAPQLGIMGSFSFSTDGLGSLRI